MFGWLTPKKELVTCRHFEHLEVALQKWLIGHSEFYRALQPLGAEKLRVNELRKNCEALEAREGRVNAEWHTYEVANDAFNDRVYWALMRCGFVRIGEGRGELHFEALPAGIHSAYAECIRLAESEGKRAVFDPQRLSS